MQQDDQYSEGGWDMASQAAQPYDLIFDAVAPIPGPSRDVLWSTDPRDIPSAAQLSSLTPSKRRKCAKKSPESKSNPMGLSDVCIGARHRHGHGRVPIERLPSKKDKGPKKQYFCAREGCTTPAARLSDLDRHDLTQHRDTRKWFSCGFCPPGTKRAEKEFKMLYNLQASVFSSHKFSTGNADITV